MCPRPSPRALHTSPARPLGYYSEWLKSETWTEAAAQTYREAVKVVLCAEASEVSMLAWLSYVRGAGSFQVLTDNAQDRKFVGGSQQLSDRLAAALQGRVKLSSPVQSIAWGTERGPYQVVRRVSRTHVAASRVCVAHFRCVVARWG